MINTPSRKTRGVVVQPLLVGAFSVTITKHNIPRILQQFAMTGKATIELSKTVPLRFKAYQGFTSVGWY